MEEAIRHSHEIEINGCVEIPMDLSMDEFLERFIQFVEDNNWSFGGGMNEVIDGYYINADGSKGKSVLDE